MIIYINGNPFAAIETAEDFRLFLISRAFVKLLEEIEHSTFLFMDDEVDTLYAEALSEEGLVLTADNGRLEITIKSVVGLLIL